MPILFTNTKSHHPKTLANTSRHGALRIPPTRRIPAWTPQPSGLSRDETRELVLEMIG